MNNRIVLTLGLLAIIFFFCTSFCACTPKTMYDMRKLDHPVIMNGNPFIGDKSSRPALKAVDVYSAETFSVRSAGQYTSSTSGQNPIQVVAFQKIGGDDTKAITDVQIDLHSIFFYGVAVIVSGNSIKATGKVQQLNSGTSGGGEIKNEK